MIDTQKFGGYNDAPPNMIELTEKEWVQSGYFSREPVFKEFRQFIIKSLNGRDTYHNFNLHYMDENSGFAITHEFYEGKVRVFKFGCDHKYKELCYKECIDKGITHFGGCYHVNECENCGHVLSYDSGD